MIIDFSIILPNHKFYYTTKTAIVTSRLQKACFALMHAQNLSWWSLPFPVLMNLLNPPKSYSHPLILRHRVSISHFTTCGTSWLSAIVEMVHRMRPEQDKLYHCQYSLWFVYKIIPNLLKWEYERNCSYL